MPQQGLVIAYGVNGLLYSALANGVVTSESLKVESEMAEAKDQNGQIISATWSGYSTTLDVKLHLVSNGAGGFPPSPTPGSACTVTAQAGHDAEVAGVWAVSGGVSKEFSNDGYASVSMTLKRWPSIVIV